MTKKKVSIGIGLVAAVIVAGGLVYEYERVCCGPPRIPLDQYWFDRINAAHDHGVREPSQPH